MKKIFNIVMFFFILAFTLVFSLLSEPSAVYAQQPIKSNDYIIGTQSETVVLISNNINNGKLSSRQKDNNDGCSFTTPFFMTLNNNNDLLNKETIKFNKDDNNYLSNNEQKAHKIRAP